DHFDKNQKWFFRAFIDQQNIRQIPVSRDDQSKISRQRLIPRNHLVTALAQEDDAGLPQESLGELFHHRLGDDGTWTLCQPSGLAVRKRDQYAFRSRNGTLLEEADSRQSAL